MATVIEIPDFRIGKQTRRGQPTPTEPQLVTAVSPVAVDNFIGARNRKERIAHLRRVRDEGKLICSPGRLQQSLRRGRHRVRRAYVFVGPASHVPRIKREPRERITEGGIGPPIEI